MAQTSSTSTARELLARGLRREILAALAREPGLTRAELYARMLPGSTAVSAVSAVRTYCAGGRWPSAEQLDVMAAGLGVASERLLAAPGLNGEHARRLLDAVERLLGVAFDRDADADALVSEVEQTLAAISPPSASATD